MHNFKRFTRDWGIWRKKNVQNCMCDYNSISHNLTIRFKTKKKNKIVRLDMIQHKLMHMFIHVCVQVYIQAYACTYLYLGINLAK